MSFVFTLSPCPQIGFVPSRLALLGHIAASLLEFLQLRENEIKWTFVF